MQRVFCPCYGQKAKAPVIIRGCENIAERLLKSDLFFFSSRRRHTRLQGDWSSDVCSSDLTFTMDYILRFSFYKNKKEKDIGYTMDYYWNPNLTSNKTNSITHEIHNVAYMEDRKSVVWERV